jgi:hypothetical protein
MEFDGQAVDFGELAGGQGDILLIGDLAPFARWDLRARRVLQHLAGRSVETRCQLVLLIIDLGHPPLSGNDLGNVAKRVATGERSREFGAVR